MGTVAERQWIAEATVWTLWRHRGTLTAMNDVKLASLDAQTFQDICKRQMRKQKGGFTPKRYAAQFVEELNRGENVSDLGDEATWKACNMTKQNTTASAC